MTITHHQKPRDGTDQTVSDETVTEVKEPPKYHCDACSHDVTNTVRVRCAHPDCPDFDLCVSCFCRGAEPVQHKTWHDYRVLKPHSFPIFSHDWDADEELLLIEAAQKLGLGNWQAIADYVGTKNKSDCELHYLQVYTASPDFPLPRMDLAFDWSPDEFRERKRTRLQQSRSRMARKPATSQPNPSKPTMTSGPTFHQIQGYMPLRYEFETEHENEAEGAVKDMVFHEEDTQQETDLKIMVLDIYNSRLDQRTERKQLIFERHWLDFKQIQAVERKRQKQERHIHNKTKVFCRLQTDQDYALFVQGLVQEQQLRDRITTLQEWRQAGLTTIRQGEKYEREKLNRLNQLKTLLSLSNDTLYGSSPSQRNAYRSQMATLVASHGAHYYKEKFAEPASPHQNHLLTKEEQSLCSTLNIMPRPYLVIKDTLLKQYARQGFLKRKQAQILLTKINVHKTSTLFDFFVQNGWIKT